MANGVSDNEEILVFKSSTGRPNVLSRGPWAENVLGPIGFRRIDFFASKMFPFLGPNKNSLGRTSCHLGANMSVFRPQLDTQNSPKIQNCYVQEVT